MKSIASLLDIAPLYDGFILDQWGVLHDGVNGLHKGPEVIAELARLDKKLVILSNSSRRAEATLDALRRFGYDRAHFRGAVTSGEQANMALRKLVSEKEEGITRCLWFSYEPGASGLGSFGEGLEKLEAVSDIECAEFLLAQGTDMIRSQDGNHISLQGVRETGDLSAVDGVLRRGVDRGIPMHCVNPDTTVVQEGKTLYVTGIFAKRYAELGGHVLFHGKPYLEHFEAAIAMFGEEVARDRICHVGDSLHHDIQGANVAQIASVWVAGGSSIHAGEMGLEGEPRAEGVTQGGLDDAAMERAAGVIAANGHFVPTYVVHSLSHLACKNATT